MKALRARMLAFALLPLASVAIAQTVQIGRSEGVISPDSDPGSKPTANADGNAIAVGNGADASTGGKYADTNTGIAIGAGAAANSAVPDNNGVAIGAGASATGYRSVAIGAGSVADKEATFSVGTAEKGGQRRIVGTLTTASRQPMPPPWARLRG